MADPASAAALLEIAGRILPLGREGQSCLGLAIPDVVSSRLEAADSLLAEMRRIVLECGVKLEYFEISEPRYRHYLAAALSLPRDSRILEIGAAPGHLSIGLHIAGFRLTGINLNEHWRATYPSPEWFEKLNVVEHDAEKEPLPFPDGSFQCALFTEVLEHVAIRDPIEILREIRRVLAPAGLLIFSTPNVCNISNILALMRGENVFWPAELFYGSLDRHNREYTPREVHDLIRAAGYEIQAFYGMNSHNNWRAGGAELAYELVGQIGDGEPLLRNTIVCLASA
jgi:2-polyprenyl-3-methyl-5-hydroxy-6-metoxy-1,4-benzoquinol methylase